MKKVFISTGELSGDKIASWLVKKLKSENTEISFEAIGGKFLESENIKLYDRIENFSFVGILEIVRHLPFIFKHLKNVVNYILKETEYLHNYNQQFI